MSCICALASHLVGSVRIKQLYCNESVGLALGFHFPLQTKSV